MERQAIGDRVTQYAGIDVSLELLSVCLVDGRGKIFREGKVLSEPTGTDRLVFFAWLELARIGLEAGPLSQWLCAGSKEAGLAVELLETRRVRDAFTALPVRQTGRTRAASPS